MIERDDSENERERERKRGKGEWINAEWGKRAKRQRKREKRHPHPGDFDGRPWPSANSGQKRDTVSIRAARDVSKTSGFGETARKQRR